MSDIKNILESVRKGEMAVEEAMLAIKKAPFEDIGYAKVDLHRGILQGAAEVIYGAGKTAEQMIGIIEKMQENGQKTILITRLSEESAGTIVEKCDVYKRQQQEGLLIFLLQKRRLSPAKLMEIKW